MLTICYLGGLYASAVPENFAAQKGLFPTAAALFRRRPDRERPGQTRASRAGGARTYMVYSVSKISVNDVSVLNDSAGNILTLVTCVMNQPDYSWCVQARQKST